MQFLPPKNWHFDPKIKPENQQLLLEPETNIQYSTRTEPDTSLHTPVYKVTKLNNVRMHFNQAGTKEFNLKDEPITAKLLFAFVYKVPISEKKITNFFF